MCSAGLWLMPRWLGSKPCPSGPAGRASGRRARRGSASASWTGRAAVPCARPTDDALVEHDRLEASQCRVVITTPSRSASSSRNACARCSASSSTPSSVLRRSMVSVAFAATTFTRLGCSRGARPCRPRGSRAGGRPSARRRERDDLGGSQAGVVAHRRGRRASVVRLAGDHDLLPGDALHASDHPDGDTALLEDRPLFDVQLDVRMGGRPGAGVRALVADAGRPSPTRAVDANRVERGLERQPAGVHEAAHHVGREAGTFLVREEGDSSSSPQPKNTTPDSSTNATALSLNTSIIRIATASSRNAMVMVFSRPI